MFKTLDGKKLTDVSSAQIFDELNEFLKQPRYEGDVCIVLTMPANIIMKAAEKLNSGIMEAYTDLDDQKTGMTRILVAVESYVEVERLALMLDTDIKLILASEHNIDATEDDIENAKHSAASAIAETESEDAGLGIGDDNE